MKTTPHVDTSPSYPRSKYRVFQDVVFPQYFICLLRKVVKRQYVNNKYTTSHTAL